MSTRHWAYPGGVGGRKASVALAEFSPDYPDPLLHCLWSDNGGVEHPRHRQQPPALVGRLRSIAATPVQRYPSGAANHLPHAPATGLNPLAPSPSDSYCWFSRIWAPFLSKRCMSRFVYEHRPRDNHHRATTLDPPRPSAAHDARPLVALLQLPQANQNPCP